MAGFTFVTLHIVDGDLADHNIVVVVVDRILPWLVSVVRVLVYTTELVVVGLSLVALAVLVVVYTTAVTITTGVSAACRSCPWKRGCSGGRSSSAPGWLPSLAFRLPNDGLSGLASAVLPSIVVPGMRPPLGREELINRFLIQGGILGIICSGRLPIKRNL